MKKKLKKGLLLLAAGFVGLFGLRLAYGYLAHPTAAAGGPRLEAVSQEFEFSRKNYASEKLSVQGVPSVDQKYEKVASLFAASNEFERDEQRLREIIKKQNALIQFEQNSGLAGTRRLHMAVGVSPDRFDELISEVRHVGTLAALRIDKLDKTNEYKGLKAARLSREKSRDSLVALKSRSGNIEEFLSLEQRILEVEQEIQELGVKLGDYDEENEFCTVKYTLTEQAPGSAQISFLHRVRVALVWTINYYALGVGLLFVASGLLLITVVLLEKLNWIPAAAANLAERA